LAAVIALTSFKTVHPINLAGSFLAFGTLLWYKLSISKQASAGAGGRAFYVPEKWRVKVGRLLIMLLACMTICALRLLIQQHASKRDL
jgi:hypothetical protein